MEKEVQHVQVTSSSFDFYSSLIFILEPFALAKAVSLQTKA